MAIPSTALLFHGAYVTTNGVVYGVPPKGYGSATEEADKQAAAAQTKASEVKKPYEGKSGEEIDPTKVDVYRGGADFTLKPGEYKYTPQTVRGPSLNTNPRDWRVVKNGGPHKIIYIPLGLKIMQQGEPTHFEVVPRQPIIQERMQELLNQIKTE